MTKETEVTEAIDPVTLKTLIEGEPPTEEEAHADFLSGFSGEKTAEPVKTEAKTEAEPEKEEEQESEAEKTETPEDKIMGMISGFKEDIDKQIRKLNGRYGDLNSQFKEVITKISSADDSPNKKQLEDAMKNREKREALKEDYPESAEAIDELGKEYDSKLNDIQAKSDEKYNKLQSDVEMYKDSLVEEKHKGWKETCKSQKFNDWLSTSMLQDDEIEKLAQSPNPLDAIKLLDKYAAIESRKGEDSGNPVENKTTELDETKPDIEKKSRLAQAITPDSKGGRQRPAVKSEHDEFLAGFSKARGT